MAVVGILAVAGNWFMARHIEDDSHRYLVGGRRCYVGGGWDLCFVCCLCWFREAVGLRRDVGSSSSVGVAVVSKTVTAACGDGATAFDTQLLPQHEAWVFAQ